MNTKKVRGNQIRKGTTLVLSRPDYREPETGVVTSTEPFRSRTFGPPDKARLAHLSTRRYPKLILPGEWYEIVV